MCFFLKDRNYIRGLVYKDHIKPVDVTPITKSVSYMAGTWNSSNRTKTSTLTASHNIFETKTRTCLLSRAETEKSSGLVSSPGPEPRLHQDLVQGTGTDQDWAKTYREPRLYQDLVQGTGYCCYRQRMRADQNSGRPSPSWMPWDLL